MDSKTIYKEAIALRPFERLQLMELIANSLNEPDKRIDNIWAKEVEKRYIALKDGKLKTIPLDDIIQRYKK